MNYVYGGQTYTELHGDDTELHRDRTRITNTIHLYLDLASLITSSAILRLDFLFSIL